MSEAKAFFVFVGASEKLSLRYVVGPVHPTTSRIDNLTRLIHTLAICVTIHRGSMVYMRRKLCIERFFGIS